MYRWGVLLYRYTSYRELGEGPGLRFTVHANHSVLDDLLTFALIRARMERYRKYSRYRPYMALGKKIASPAAPVVKHLFNTGHSATIPP
jgi:hypothetical protein